MARIHPLAAVGAALSLAVLAALTVLPTASANEAPVSAMAACTGCPEPPATVPAPLTTVVTQPGSTPTTAAAPTAAQPAPERVVAGLNVAAVRPKPKVASKATGQFAAVIGDNVISWALATDSLTGAGTARIESGAAGVSGPTMLTLCAKCAQGAAGNIQISDGMEKQLRSGNVYVEVSTPKNPNGELRGQIKN